VDVIEIRGLRVMAVVGVLPHEREAAQPLQIDLAVHSDLRSAGRSDELDDTVNYGALCESVSATVRESKDLLLERVAQRIADTVLSFPRVDSVEVTLSKLRPPIPELVEASAVRITRSLQIESELAPLQHEAIVALGSNLGDRIGYLRQAVQSLGAVMRLSQIYETAPVGGPGDQGAYLNMVAAVATDLDPFAMLRRLQRIEAEANRQRIVHWGPRTLDLDLLFYDDFVIASPDLTIPHPRYAQRRFVLAPLSDVSPERCPTGWNETLPPDAVTVIGSLDDQISR
jgi:dihydroneopterin aldolase/2-amino-4-hydroxy-6-hydroxymethyldihydropteridine diphosphokinase